MAGSATPDPATCLQGKSRRSLVERLERIQTWITFGFVSVIMVCVSVQVFVRYVLVGMILAGIPGSSTAESAALSTVFIPPMWERGYRKNFAVAIIACASSLGAIIPPACWWSSMGR